MAYNFINPYNFVPLGKGKSKVGNSEERNLKGVIEYTLLTKTPLFIPNTSNDHAILPEEAKGKKDDSYHKSYEFFAYEDLSGLKEPKEKEDLLSPVIPGSEIRGMLRSYYEILSNSCMSAIDDKVVLSRRNAQVFKAGLIHKNGDEYKLVTNVKLDCILRTKKDGSIDTGSWKNVVTINSRQKAYKQFSKQDGDEIKISYRNNGRGNPVVISFGGLSDKETGYLIKGEAGPEFTDDNDNTLSKEKHCAHVFIKPESLKEKDVDINVLDKILKIYKTQGVSEYSMYSEKWNEFKNKSGEHFFPVYYSEIKGYVMLSPASITREVYKANITNIIGAYNSCDNKEKLCPACSLFGMLNTNQNTSIASRIRVCDLVVKDEKDNINISELYDDPITLKELSSPKMSSVEFYLNRPDNAWFWTFDYYIDKDGKIYGYDAIINGRKFYWHNVGVEKNDYATIEQNERNCTIRPVSKNITFKGKIYFDGISKTELNQLIYLLNAGCDEKKVVKKECGYKIGKGKPYGLGSVTLNVDKVVLREIDINDETIEYKEKPFQEYEKPEWDKTIEEYYGKITNYNPFGNEVISRGYKVSYPSLKEGGDIFEWFTNNHKKNEYGILKSKMANSRAQMAFEMYMKPLNPILQKTVYSVGDVLEAEFLRYGETKDRFKYGVFVKMEGGESALMHKSNARSKNLNEYHNAKFRVKILEIKDENGKKKYSVTDSI